MSLSAEDKNQLLEWFETKENSAPDSEDYYKYRDLIFTKVFSKLSDYFSVLKLEWKNKHHISEDDCMSIIHDGLLAAVSNFKPQYESKERMTQFVTYLTTVLKNLVIDNARKDHIRYAGKGDNRKKRNMGRIPASLYISLDAIISTLERGQGGIDSGNLIEAQYVAPLFKFITEEDETLNSQLSHKLLVQHLMKYLSQNDRKMLQSIMDGDSLSTIARSLGLTQRAVKLRVNKVAKKFGDIKQELWASKKAS